MTDQTPSAVSPAAGSPGMTSRRGPLRAWGNLMTWRLPGLPKGLGTIQWILAASTRMPMATTAALLTAWTGIIVALWVGALSAIGSLVVTAFGVAVSGHAVGVLTFTSKTSGGIIFLSALVAAVFGFGAGFSATYASSLFGGISLVAAALFVGIVVGLIYGLIAISMEARLLAWRGYRRPSRREEALYLFSPVQTVIDNMKLDSSPIILIMDSPMPQAWTYSRHVVLSKGLLEGLEPGELAGVLAHEFTHWRRGDGLALRMVWCFAWPVAVLYSLGMFLSGARFGVPPESAGAAATPHSSGQSTLRGAVSFLSFFGWMILWPSWLLTRFVIVPMTTADSRKAEYEADAGAAAADVGGGLQRALEQLSAFEMPRNAWDAALTTTHPPIELRIEALENGTVKAPGDIKKATAERVSSILVLLFVLAVVAVSPHIPVWHHNHNDWWW